MLNALLAKRIAAVSPKRNTTRTNLLAVASDQRSGVQLRFYDTPGFVAAGAQDGGSVESRRSGDQKGRVERSVMVSAREAVAQLGLATGGNAGGSGGTTLVVIDAAKKLTGAYEAALGALLRDLCLEAARREATYFAAGTSLTASSATKKNGGKVSVAASPSAQELAAAVAKSLCLVLNKVDLIRPKQLLLPAAEAFDEMLQGAVRDAVGLAIATATGAESAAGAAAPAVAKSKKGKGADGSFSIPVFMVSATSGGPEGRGGGLSELRSALHARAFPGPWDDDEHLRGRSASDSSASSRSTGSNYSRGVYDQVASELDDEGWAEECIREQCFRYLHKEVPYRMRQSLRLWELRPGERVAGVPPTINSGTTPGGSGVLHVHVDLVVKSRSHKKMAIGPGGGILRRITKAARVRTGRLPLELLPLPLIISMRFHLFYQCRRTCRLTSEYRWS